jgi:hypothetical protein
MLSCREDFDQHLTMVNGEVARIIPDNCKCKFDYICTVLLFTVLCFMKRDR